ncbi:MAG: hypothetical protein JNL25_05275 [Rhodospirillaceae bacterium]|nr:hypothetical protein [Rhodospirillaceae bacterium]
MKISFRCPPELDGLLPVPKPGRLGLPDWLRSMPTMTPSADFGYEVETVKQCPPFIDAMTAGFLMPLVADVRVENGRFSWDWDPPPSTLGAYTRAPIAFHVADQLRGTPFFDGDSYAVKFINFWVMETPPGWGLLCTHPAHRSDLPFRTVTGLVHTDNYPNFVHFPALWSDPGFSGVLPRGTPVAQCYPVPLANPELDVGTLDPDDASRLRETKSTLREESGAYRRHHRHKD